MLNAEGRSVAAAMLCRTPMSRDDACLYTHGALLSESDRRLQRVLAKDYTAGEAQRLLAGDVDDGAAAHGSRVPGSPPQPAAAALSGRGGNASEAPQHSLAVALEVKYGYPGARAPDISVVDSRASAAAMTAHSRKPQSEEELREARSRRGARRSGTAPSIAGRTAGSRDS